MGIYLTQAATTCSVRADEGLSPRFAGVGGSLFDRGGLSEVFVPVAMARRFLLCSLWGTKSVASVPRSPLSVGMCSLSWPSGADGRDDLSEQPTATDLVVSRSMVGDQPEERCQRHGASWAGPVDRACRG